MATEERPCEEPPKETKAPLLVGSDCSGMCTESHALDALGVRHEHAFCSEVWEPAIRCVRAMERRPRVLYRDVTERELGTVPSVDLYVCGFPCQPNSVMNVKRESSTPDGRRDPMACALAYIEAKRPRYWVLENVVGLMHVAKGAVWRGLLDRLDALEGYAWDYRVLDPCKHADSPQSRSDQDRTQRECKGFHPEIVQVQHRRWCAQLDCVVQEEARRGQGEEHAQLGN